MRSPSSYALLGAARLFTGTTALSALSTYGVTPELEVLLEGFGEKRYRAKQIREWIFDKGVTDFQDMNNLPKSLRDRLASTVREYSLELLSEKVSSIDGTVKRAYAVGGRSDVVESVLMRYDDGRNTACISSQAGCAMGCVFCATGQMGFRRQLSGLEIFEQAARFDSSLRREDSRLNRVVFMGMGEPLLNFEAVSEAISRLHADLGIGARRVTVSTVGVTPAVRKLTLRHPNVGFAISLHAANDEDRSALIPANARYGGIDALMSAARDHWLATKRQVTFEWALAAGGGCEDDTNVVRAKAQELGRLLRRYGMTGPASHVNVIPLNPTPSYTAGAPASASSIQHFIDVLNSLGVSATVRLRRGIDINAGCGQLATELLAKEERTTSHSVTAATSEEALSQQQGAFFDDNASSSQ